MEIVKEQQPMKSLPVLTLEDGQSFTQSIPMARFAATGTSLYPADAVDALKVDEIVALAGEIMDKAPSDADPALKQKKREDFAAGFLITALGYLLTKLNDNNTFFVNDTLSLADVAVFALVDMVVSGKFDFVGAEVIPARLKKHYDDVKASSLMVEYLKHYQS